ncbi:MULTISPECIES: hypothetical protein [Enterobacterales]|uniref:hypothetical protein n=1 Tax=Enterobacterales TaxID=91347 RepID=UPI000BA9ECA1|nr:hypothetical protein [Escherichia coli]PAS86004.1 hypothetical protein CDN89_17135 [Escherichia coli]HDC4235838.1 hypothetical protein [Escherichia coli]HEM8345864.1 hypothetical protein [Providencia stuartii]
MGFFDNIKAKNIRASIVKLQTECVESVFPFLIETSKNELLCEKVDLKTASLMFTSFISAYFLAINKVYEDNEDIFYKLKELLVHDLIMNDRILDARKRTLIESFENYYEIILPFIYSNKGRGENMLKTYNNTILYFYLTDVFTENDEERNKFVLNEDLYEYTIKTFSINLLTITLPSFVKKFKACTGIF